MALTARNTHRPNMVQSGSRLGIRVEPRCQVQERSSGNGRKESDKTLAGDKIKTVNGLELMST